MNKRQFLNYLAASPLLASGVLRAQDELLYRTLDSILDLDPGLPQQLSSVAGVFELEQLAARVLPPAHFGYIYSGAGNGESKQANRDAYDQYDIQPRRLQGVDQADLSTEIFGETWDSPLFLSPTNGHRAIHPLGELATAQGSANAGATMMLSSLTNTPVEQVNQARGDRPVWFQLYPTNDEAIRYELVKRAEDAGCPAIVVTVDDIGGRGSEISAPYYNRDTRDCTLCHQRELGISDFLQRKAMFQSYKDLPGFSIDANAMTFEDIRKLREQVRGKLLVKGIMHPVDALECLKAGVDGIVVSNHGGRVDSGGLGTLDALPAIVQAVQGRMLVLLDGGIRRGTDVFKALALGADAVGFGRPYLWGLAAYGAEGVQKSVQLVEIELRRAMIQAGVSRVSDIAAQQLLGNA